MYQNGYQDTETETKLKVIYQFYVIAQPNKHNINSFMVPLDFTQIILQSLFHHQMLNH
jgi:hypothetical protein